MPSKMHDDDDEPKAPLRGYAESYIKLANSRSIFFSENVTKKSAAELSAMLIYYDHIDAGEPINLYLNSNGGDVAGLVNIYDVMQMISAPVHTILLGKCYSAGAVLLAAGEPGHRYALPSAKVMVHGVQFGFPLAGHDLKTSKNYLEFVEDHNDMIMKILAKHTGQALAKIKQDCSGDVWMDAKTAQKYSIIDNIIQ